MVWKIFIILHGALYQIYLSECDGKHKKTKNIIFRPNQVQTTNNKVRKYVRTETMDNGVCFVIIPGGATYILIIHTAYISITHE